MFVFMENMLMIDYFVSMEYDDKVRFEVESFNKVGFFVVVSMDGFIIDYILLNLVFI